MQETRLDDGSDINLLLQPLRAFLGDTLLREPIRESQGVVFNSKGLLLGLFRVKRLDEARFAEKESEAINPIELVFEGGVGVDSKIRRDKGQVCTGADTLAQEVADVATPVVIPDS